MKIFFHRFEFGFLCKFLPRRNLIRKVVVRNAVRRHRLFAELEIVLQITLKGTIACGIYCRMSLDESDGNWRQQLMSVAVVSWKEVVRRCSDEDSRKFAIVWMRVEVWRRTVGEVSLFGFNQEMGNEFLRRLLWRIARWKGCGDIPRGERRLNLIKPSSKVGKLSRDIISEIFRNENYDVINEMFLESN